MMTPAACCFSLQYQSGGHSPLSLVAAMER